MGRLVTPLLFSCFAYACGGSVTSTSHDGGGQGDATSDSDSGPDGSPKGGDDASATDGGGLDAPVTSDASTDPDNDGPWSAVCPEDPPEAGIPCNVPGIACEYGNAWWNPDCDVIMQCAGPNPTWGPDEPTGGSPCIGPPGPNPSSCPMGGIIQGACSEAGLYCYYNQGDICECHQSGDAGPPQWACLPGDTRCGTTRPRLGSPCAYNGLECVYYALCGYGQECVNGVWVPSYTSCQ